ncbi:plasmid mobilization relaxosome protein MobC [Mucilaginibacter rubeus]|uniref:Plasmid mobilization relaxosome protein MobC n=2 Tax=Sphingobacteriaceae TaxID=84566 RepID=A0AAE6JLK4_9SPHI|nr:plasmid mobilization relaxosome protein MobC [Mucilaginibacter rubeus]QEM20623.1 plasmid mobilization relaxosome protein MobC [Mucilaginibacter gossypii]QTE47120.1 plasmid mobilization relaxosome protein MobC [Mucilaginibacter rubeus]QTE53722.1 plasmid mobilization relaxosome protein MobC [Mucilaginibacter rubeus]QTE60225.1 plasmid mobilization relaxosome protein MobC [Mucilaginibacter rubeus]
MDEVKAQKKTGRWRVINFRLTTKEYDLLSGRWKQTTLKKLSAYVRQVLFGRKLTVKTRNVSADELVAELVLLKKELNAIGVNFNQAVHRLHTLDHASQMQDWLRRWDADKMVLFKQLPERRVLHAAACDRADAGGI